MFTDIRFIMRWKVNMKAVCLVLMCCLLGGL